MTSGGASPDAGDRNAGDRIAAAGPGAENAELGPRPLIERIGLGAIAAILAVVFGGLGVAALAGGEVFLAVMAGIGALMTLWAAASTLRR